MNDTDAYRILNWQLRNLIYIDDLDDLFNQSGLWTEEQRDAYMWRLLQNERMREQIRDRFGFSVEEDETYLDWLGAGAPEPGEREEEGAPEPANLRELSRRRVTPPPGIDIEQWKEVAPKVRNRSIYKTELMVNTIRTLSRQGMNRTNIAKEIARMVLIEKGRRPTARAIRKSFRGYYDVVISELGRARGRRRRR